MPKTDNLRSAFLKVSKTIADDSQYARVLRSID
jgi:hypothetical protein